MPVIHVTETAEQTKARLFKKKLADLESRRNEPATLPLIKEQLDVILEMLKEGLKA